MDLFRATREFTYLGFFDALYFSGVTATVLGYGDITPMSDTLQIVSFLQSGFGFAILTCVVTYIISVVSGVTDRNILSLRMWTETDRTGDGVLTVIQALSDEEPVYFRLRLQTLLDNVYHIQPKMQQFPILDIFYRSKDPVFSPEIMIRSVTELAIAAQIVSADPKHRGLKTSAEKLGEASVEIMKLITLQYLSKQARSRLKNPVFEKEDEARLEQIWSRLTQALPDLQLENAPHNKQTLQTIYRLRIFLNEMKHFSEWDRDEL
ncbi:MAG: potassium channel family protein [Balneolales bacterium]